MDIAAFVDRITGIKVRLLQDNTFFGLLMQHIVFAIDPQCPTACTDATRIYFGPAFCEGLPDDQLAIVMLHELMHIVLGHCLRGAHLDNYWYNVAADIVVNSNIALALGLPYLQVAGQQLMHLAPDGREGHLYNAEEVYAMLVDMLPPPEAGAGAPSNDGEGGSGPDGDANTPPTPPTNGNNEADGGGQKAADAAGQGRRRPTLADYRNGFHDDHSLWQDACGTMVQGQWRQRIADAAATAAGMGCGDTTGLARRTLEALNHPVVDWRVLLNNFIQSEIHDYSFAPPDRRYEGDIFLPDFNVPDQRVHNLWLVLDTSGSISNKALTRAFSEVKGAIDQFDGLDGWVSFFDTAVTDPVPIADVHDLLAIRPRGGGGTSFHAIFDYFATMPHADEVSCIIIFTDGYAMFPPVSAAKGTPVFWLLNNTLVTPPWGTVARYLPPKR